MDSREQSARGLRHEGMSPGSPFCPWIANGWERVAPELSVLDSRSMSTPSRSTMTNDTSTAVSYSRLGALRANAIRAVLSGGDEPSWAKGSAPRPALLRRLGRLRNLARLRRPNAAHAPAETQGSPPAIPQ